MGLIRLIALTGVLLPTGSDPASSNLIYSVNLCNCSLTGNIEINAVGKTDIVGAGRHQAVVNAMMTKVAFSGNALVVVEFNRVIGAGGYAGLTPRALVHIQHNDAVAALCNGIVRARIDTCWLIAVAADIHVESKRQFTTDPPRPVLGHINQFDPVGRPVFLFAGHLAGFAAPASVVVYCQ
jgi:hypothetical protein